MSKKVNQPPKSSQPKQVDQWGGSYEGLSTSEQQVYDLIIKENLTQKQITIRRGTSKQATNKIIISLRKKGFLTLNNVPKKQVDKIVSTLANESTKIRLHGQEWNIQLLWKDNRYSAIKSKANTTFVDGNTVRLYRNAIEVYSGQSFYSENSQKATAISMSYWQRFFIRLESQFKIIIIKPKSQNINLVNQHYADTDNAIAEDMNSRNEKIKVYTNEDGKLWFTCDRSGKIDEGETLHPDTAKQDMGEVITPFLNDLRDNKPPVPSEVMKIIGEQAKNTNEIAIGLNLLIKILTGKGPLDDGLKEEQDEKGQKRLPPYIG